MRVEFLLLDNVQGNTGGQTVEPAALTEAFRLVSADWCKSVPPIAQSVHGISSGKRRSCKNSTAVCQTHTSPKKVDLRSKCVTHHASWAIVLLHG